MEAHDAIVIGGGHNGLVCAAYLARAGMRTLVVEARPQVGGTAASERFAGVTVNICNCDHITFRTTRVHDELELGSFGLRYLDLDPSQHHQLWEDDRSWSSHHDLEQTVASLERTHPRQAVAYRRYAAAAMPVAELILAAAAAGPPRPKALVCEVLARRARGATTLLRWSRASAAKVMRSFFDDEALVAPAMVVGPVVWGVAPNTPGTGLAALGYAMRHVGQVGRPVGGSGALTESLRAALEHHGGQVLTSTRATGVLCEGGGVSGVELDGDPERVARAPVIVAACDPQQLFVSWLRNAPPQADRLVQRWRERPHDQGYESKLDVVVDRLPRFRDGHEVGATTVISPRVDEIEEAHRLLGLGEVASRPGFLVNVPSLHDCSMAPPGRHVLSLEVLYTPHGLRGGWPSSHEPRRWLELLATRLEPGFLDSIVDWRAMTPDRYEREFHLPLGHAASFGGGPLAALRGKDRELTRYTTPVQGLYLTGAATFPGAGVWGASGRNTALTVLDRQ